uniref:Uncharacterized protein n=1 Tax=Trieres chinensis TaxID=1514140 RepID=A0A7S1ZDM6_TRICV
MTAQSEEKAEGPDADQPPPPQPEKAGDDDDGSDGDTNAATGGDMAEFSDVDEKTAEEELVEELEAAPLHLHTLRIPPRLRGTSTPVSVRSRSSSRSRSRSSSRDVSPSPHASAGGHKRRDSKGSDAVPSLIMGESTAGTGTGSSAASVASIEDIDPDILHDQKGLEDLTPPPPHEIAMGPLAASPSPHTSGLLPSVNERMSEETLDDCHAFNDLTSALHTSLRSLKDERDGADGDGCDGLLATLAENEDEDEDEEGSSDHGKEKSSALTKENLAQLEKQETEAVVVAEVAA